MPKRHTRARPVPPPPAPEPPDRRQLTIEGSSPESARKAGVKAQRADQVAAMAARGVANRVDPATGRVVLRVTVTRSVAERLARAIRESRNLEELARELLERHTEV